MLHPSDRIGVDVTSYNRKLYTLLVLEKRCPEALESLRALLPKIGPLLADYSDEHGSLNAHLAECIGET